MTIVVLVMFLSNGIKGTGLCDISQKKQTNFSFKHEIALESVKLLMLLYYF